MIILYIFANVNKNYQYSCENYWHTLLVICHNADCELRARPRA